MKFSKSSVITVMLALTLVAAITVGGSISYFTSQDEKINTFTMGDVEIDLTEDEWDENDGQNMTPGATLYKNPTVTGVHGNSYMRIKLELTDEDGTILPSETPEQQARIAKIMDTIYYSSAAYGSEGSCIEGNLYSQADIDAFIDADVLKKGVNTDLFDENADGATAYYNYIGIFREGDKAVLFTHIIIPTDWSRDDLQLLGEYNIKITAQAIQTTGFQNADEAFAQMELEQPTTTTGAFAAD